MSAESAPTAGLRALGSRLDEVEEALARLEEGSYGRCVGCGAELPAELLSKEPLARLCQGCRPPLDAGGDG